MPSNTKSKVELIPALKRHCIVVGLYTLLTLAMSLPLIFFFSSHVVGTGGDVWQTLWRFAAKENELRQAIGTGATVDLVKHEILGGGEERLVNLSAWPWLLVSMVFSQPVTYNLIWLVSFIAAGYGMYLLMRYLLQRSVTPGNPGKWVPEVAPFIAGVMYMFLPFHVAHGFGHFGALQIQWLPFLVLATVVWLNKPTMLGSLCLSALAIVQAWSEHHYMLWFGLFLIITAFQGRGLFSLQNVSYQRLFGYGLLVVAIVAFGIALPYLPTIRLAAHDSNYLELGNSQLIRFSADIFAYVMPAAFHPLFGGISHFLFTQHFTGNVSEATQFLGLTPLLLILFFHQRIPRKQMKWWSSVALIFGIISLGPRLHLLGYVTPLPLPYALIDTWPFLATIRAVGRAGIMVGFASAILLGWVLATQQRRWLPGVVLLGLILLEFLFVPVPLQAIDTSPLYTELSAISAKRIIEIPAATNYVAASKALYASARHHKEVLGSIALERAQASQAYDELKRTPGLKQLLYLRTTDIREDRREFFNQSLVETMPDVLKWYDVGAILIHHDSISALQAATLKRFLEERLQLLPQVVKESTLYRLPNQPIPSDGVFLRRGDGWQGISYDEKTDSVYASFNKNAAVQLVNTRSTVKLELSFTIHEALPETPLTASLDASQIASLVVNPGETVRIPLMLKNGEHTLDFTSQLPQFVVIRNPILSVVP